MPCKWTNWIFLVSEVVGRHLKSQVLFWPSVLQLGLIDSYVYDMHSYTHTYSMCIQL